MIGHSYLVTARHVLDKTQKDAADGLIHVRYNTTEGGVGWLEVPLEEWGKGVHPSDRAVDVAVLPQSAPPDIRRYVAIGRRSVATADIFAAHNIGIGDEVFACGLFVNHTGSLTNEPVIRIGNLAAIPKERVDTKQFGLAEVFLVEFRSTGGLSGSPVFVNLGFARAVNEQFVFQPDPKDWDKGLLLGIVRGHWEMDPERSVVQSELVNMGMAIVTPAQKLLDIIDEPELKRKRDARDRAALEATLPTPDSPAKGPR
jgi:hypothetical protein